MIEPGVYGEVVLHHPAQGDASRFPYTFLGDRIETTGNVTEQLLRFDAGLLDRQGAITGNGETGGFALDAFVDDETFHAGLGDAQGKAR
jgi:hypothetical protein